jgi:hypothetical protein
LADDGAAPGGVARISAIEGSVAIQRGDANAAVNAVLNAPVLPADYVNTGSNSRAEVEFDSGTMVRLGSDVQMRFSHIDENAREIQLAEGTIDVRLLRGANVETTIDTPSISIVPRESGSYRISVTHDGQTKVTVRSGRADIETPDDAQPLRPGTTLVAEGPANEPNIHTQPELAMDDFDAFNADRDRIYTRVAAAAPYVDQNLPGAEDLPSYGHWETDSQYGNVWVPNNEPATWAPYQDGNWVWEDYYGWTWVAAEPWGWAPYHYGRWYHSPRWGWAWVPVSVTPGIAVVPAWSPALVGFVGFGAQIGAVNVGVGFGFGNVGWVPLAPYETFHPWWGPHATVVNVTNIDVNIGRVYRNANFNYGVTSVSSRRWLAGDFSRRTPMTVAALRNEHFGAVRGGLPLVPSQANLRFTNREVPQQLSYHATRSFAGHGYVAPRTAFETQQQTLARSFHTSAPPERFGSTNSVRFAAPAARDERVAPRPESAANPWSRFNGGRNTDYGRPQFQGRPQGEAHPYTAGSGYSSRPAEPNYSRPRESTPTFSRPQEAAPNYPRPQDAAPNYTRPRDSAPAYARPPQYNGGGYARPIDNYPRPSENNSRPSYSGGQNNPRPQYNGGGFTRPSNENSSHPSYENRGGGQTYARPQYNGGGNVRPAPQGGGQPQSHAAPQGGGDRGGDRERGGGGDRAGNHDRGAR